jgi:hypothetical protein
MKWLLFATPKVVDCEQSEAISAEEKERIEAGKEASHPTDLSRASGEYTRGYSGES